MFLDSCYLSEADFRFIVDHEKFPWKTWDRSSQQCPLCRKNDVTSTVQWIAHLAFCSVACKEYFKTQKRMIPPPRPLPPQVQTSQSGIDVAPLEDNDIEMRSASGGSDSNSSEITKLASSFKKSCSTNSYAPTSSSHSSVDSEDIRIHQIQMKEERKLEKLKEAELQDRIKDAENCLNELAENYSLEENEVFWDAISKFAEKKLKKKHKPRFILTESFVEFWHAPYTNDKKRKIDALAAILPLELCMDISKEEMRGILNEFEEISRPYRSIDNPRYLTSKHIEEALAVRLTLENGEMERRVKLLPKVRKLSMADIGEIMEFLELNSDPLPEMRNFSKKTSTIKSQTMVELVNKAQFRNLFHVRLAESDREMYYSAPRRLAQLKFGALIEEFNAARDAEKIKISEHLFRKLIPEFIEEPSKIDAFVCICGVCFNLRSLGDKICSCLYVGKFTETKMSYEALFDEIFKCRGCENVEWNLGSNGKVVPLLCSKLKCACNPDMARLTPLQLMFRRWPGLENYVNNDENNELKLRVTLFTENGEGTERATVAVPDLFEKFSTEFIKSIEHYQSNKLTSTLTSRLRNQLVDTTDELVFEVDFSDDYVSRPGTGAMSTQSGYLSKKTKFILHVLGRKNLKIYSNLINFKVCWGYKTVNGKKEKKRFESVLVMKKETSGGVVYDKSPELVKKHILKSLKFIEEENVFDRPNKILIMADNASEYKSQFVICDLVDDAWGDIPIIKIQKEPRHGKVTKIKN